MYSYVALVWWESGKCWGVKFLPRTSHLPALIVVTPTIIDVLFILMCAGHTSFETQPYKRKLAKLIHSQSILNYFNWSLFLWSAKLFKAESGYVWNALIEEIIYMCSSLLQNEEDFCSMFRGCYGAMPHFIVYAPVFIYVRDTTVVVTYDISWNQFPWCDII